MIEIRSKVLIPEKFKSFGKDLKVKINDYMYRNMNLIGAIHRVRDNYLYKRLTKDTGKLGKSMTPEKVKINQYSSFYGFYFDPKIAPHASTQIPENDRGGTTIVGRNKKLAIPFPNGPADVRGRRVSPKSLGGGFTAKKGLLFKDKVPYFILKSSVFVPQRVFASGLVAEFEREITPQINKLALEAVQRELNK